MARLGVWVAMAGIALAAGSPPVNPVPNKIYPATGLTTELNTTSNGRLLQLQTPDGVSMKVRAAVLPPALGYPCTMTSFLTSPPRCRDDALVGVTH